MKIYKSFAMMILLSIPFFASNPVVACEGDPPCEAITNQVLDDYLKSICQRAVDEPWDVDTCQPCVDWGYTDPE